MDLTMLARLQFGSTTIYHFLFVPLTLGLSVLVAWMQYRHYKTGDEAFGKLTRYFGTLFLINFAMGVVTGIVQEFQFGMNWSNYSRFVGDIFGAPLAVEALAAFFLESTFLGLWIFGRDKLPKKVHLATICLVAFASNLSAFWIIVANSFMQSPTGYVIRQTVNGPRAEMTDFGALIFNPHVWIQFPHVVLGGFTTAAVFVLAICAFNILKKNETEVFGKLIRPIAIFGIVSIALTIGFGDLHGKYLAKYQPMKLAAAEALWHTTEKAPLALVAAINPENEKNEFEISIPQALSFMATNDPNAEVEGLVDLQGDYTAKYGPGNYIPPVAVSFWSFRVMVYLGSALMFILLGVAILSKKAAQMPWLMKILVLILPIPYLCNSFGWILTEIGRQPWLVHGVLKLSEGVSTSGAVTAMTVALSLGGFIALYGILAVFDVFLMVRFIKEGLHSLDEALESESEVQNAW